MPRIRSVEVVRCPPRWLLLRVETDDGEVGWGEAIGDLHEEVETALASAGEKIIGRDSSEIERIHQELLYGRFWRDGPILNTVAAAVEMALWDLHGKELGAPIHQLLGGKVRDRVLVYRNLWGSNAEQFASSAKAALDEGLTAMKVSPAGPLANVVSDADLTGMSEIVAAVRNAVGSKPKVAVDLHGRCSPSAARRAIALLAPNDPWFVEEPMLPGSAEAMGEFRELKVSQPISIACGERLLSRRSALDHLFPTPAVDIIQPDISLMGLRDTFAVGLAAEAVQIGLAPHCPYGPIQTAASLQIAAACPAHIGQEVQSLGGAGLPGGQSGAGWAWSFNLLSKPFEVVEGHVEVRTGAGNAGLGIEICEDKISEFSEQWNPHPPTVWTTPDGGRSEW